MNTRSTPIRLTLEVDGDVVLQQVRLHPRRGSRTMNGSRIRVGIIGDLQPGLNRKKFQGRNHQHREICGFTTRNDSDKFFLSCSGGCFSLAGNFQFPGNRRECEQNTFSVKGKYPAPHIHEHLRYTIMATALRTPSRITTSRLSTLR